MRKTLLVYVSGKITGLPDLNKPKFKAAASAIRSEYRVKYFNTNTDVWVCNPHELDDSHDKTWSAYMRECLKAVAVCHEVYVLDDWKYSKGALVEVFVAKVLGIPIYEVETFDYLQVSYLKLFFHLLCKL